MAVVPGEIYYAPVDYLVNGIQRCSVSGGKVLTAAERKLLGEPEYDVSKRGKYRPVVVVAHDDQTGRTLVAPMYSD
jgi:hypothetical protein